MQKNVSNVTFSREFIERFKDFLVDFYKYDRYMDYIVVPTLSGKKVLSYIPILSYTDRVANEIEDLLELSKESEYQIRVLNFKYKEFKNGDPVTMRIDINSRSSEELFMDVMKSKHRKTVKSSLKRNSLTVKSGSQIELLDDFYKIFKALMNGHGTPAFDKKFFLSLKEALKESMIFYNFYDKNEIVASYALFLDNSLIYGSWGGVEDRYRDKLVGHYAYYHIIKDVCDNKIAQIFDFGRSPYGSGGYAFKHKFGAREIKIDILSSNSEDIYEKYSLASKVWKRLPNFLTDKIGPKLCRYLVDL